LVEHPEPSSHSELSKKTETFIEEKYQLDTAALAGLISSLKAISPGPALAWEAGQRCFESGLFQLCSLYYDGTSGYEIASSWLPAGPTHLDSATLPVDLNTYRLLVQTEEQWAAIRAGSIRNDNLDDFLAVADTDTKNKALSPVNESAKFVAILAIGSTSTLLLLSSLHQDVYSSAFSDSCKHLSSEQRKFHLKYLLARPLPRQKNATLVDMLQAEIEKRHADWLTMFVIDVKPFVKGLTEMYGDKAAQGLAANCLQLFATFMHSTGSACQIVGGKLLLVYYGHTKNDPELMAMQLVRAFMKLSGYSALLVPTLTLFNTLSCSQGAVPDQLQAYLELL